MSFKKPAQGHLVFLNDTDAAYLAGFFDGEGWMYVNECNRPKPFQSHRSPHYRLVVGFTNRDIALLQWIAARTGGTVHPKLRSKLTHAPAFDLRISSRPDVGQLLRAIEPYVKIKRRQVEIGLAFLALGLSRIVLTPRGKTWPRIGQHPADIEVKQALRAELQQLNIRGVKHAS